ncbi:3'-5' DNA helicase [Terramyces sp. JEL0728]|nr:3'-5' DNA helicase [Terramyces sp. JEL0728]
MSNVVEEFRDLFSQEDGDSAHVLDAENLKTWIFPINYKQRDYQYNIIKNSLFSNTLVCLPTGLGKTFIAAVIMYNYYRWFPNSIMVFMAPTRPLVNQQIEACFKITGISQEDTVELTGHSSVELRKKMWETRRIFFMTPETFRNDLQTNICPSEKVVLAVFDEAHRSTGNYAYVEVVKELNIQQCKFRVLALSATPGSDLQKVQTVINHLNIEKIESRTEESFDVAPFVHSKNIRELVVEQSDLMKKVFDRFGPFLGNVLKKLVQFKAYRIESPEKASPYGLIASRDYWRKHKSSLPKQTGNVIEGLFGFAITLCGFVQHLFNEGIYSFYTSINDFIVEAKQNGNLSKMKKDFIQDRGLIQILNNVQEEMAKPTFVSHPKIQSLVNIVLEHFANHKEYVTEETRKGNSVDMETRIMIFSTYRTSVEEICSVLKEHQPLVKPAIFIGQSTGKKGKGLKQKEQLQIINDFKSGLFNVLVATSIGEEGLDIGEIDLIICFDNKKSPIKMLQRIGRTGRKRRGEICLLLNKGQEEDDVKLARTKYKNVQKAMFDSSKLSMYSGDTSKLFPKNIEKPACEKVKMVIPEIAPKPAPKKKKVKMTEQDIDFYTNNFMSIEYDQADMSKFPNWQTAYLPLKLIPRSARCNKFVELMQQLEEYKLDEPYIPRTARKAISDSPVKKSPTPRKKIQGFEKVQIKLLTSSPLYGSQQIPQGKQYDSDAEQSMPKKREILATPKNNMVIDYEFNDLFADETPMKADIKSCNDRNFTADCEHAELQVIKEETMTENEDVIIPQTPEYKLCTVEGNESQDLYTDEDFDWNAVEIPAVEEPKIPIPITQVGRQESLASVNNSQDNFFDDLEDVNWDEIDAIVNNNTDTHENRITVNVITSSSKDAFYKTPIRKVLNNRILSSSPDFNPQRTPICRVAGLKKRNVVLSSSPNQLNSPNPVNQHSNLVRTTPLQERLKLRKQPRKPPKIRKTPVMDSKTVVYPPRKKTKKNLNAAVYFDEEAGISENDQADISSDEDERDMDTNLSGFITNKVEYESRVNSPEDFHKIYRKPQSTSDLSTQMVYNDHTKKGELYQIIHPTRRAVYAGSSDVDEDDSSMADFVVADDFVEYEQTQGRFFDCTMEIPTENPPALPDDFDTENLLDGVDLDDLIDID